MKTDQRTYNLGHHESTTNRTANATDAQASPDDTDDNADGSVGADDQRPLALSCPTCGTILPADIRREWTGECVHCRRVCQPQEVIL